MGPKKQAKKQVIQQPPKQQQPQIPQHQLHGYGRFQYANGSTFQGNWRLFNGIKMKHGEGSLKVPGNSSNGLGQQNYLGSWNEDKMEGRGVYEYASGAAYRGEWNNNKHQGKGIYEFPNGTVYEGQWKDHLMHGTGFYIDSNGRKWEGQYRDGRFQTKRQKQLLQQKQIQTRKQQAKSAVTTTISCLLEALAKSDKKTLKQNLTPFFPSGEVIKGQVKQPYSKFDERPQEKWVDFLNYLRNGRLNVLQKASSSKFLGQERVLSPQLQGIGQVVELTKQSEQRTSKAAFVNTQGHLWILAATSDEQKKK